MKYTAKGLETEPYKAYSRDAFNDEEKGVAYFAHGYQCGRQLSVTPHCL